MASLANGGKGLFGIDTAELIKNHSYWFVGGIIFLESMGVPLPGESLLIAVSLYAATTGDVAIEWMVPAAAVGAILGDNAGFLIGRRVGPPVLERYGPRVGLTEERQHLGRYLFLRHGGKVVFFGRFVAFLRTFAALLAGANQMPWGRFLLWNALGGVVWTTLYGFVPFLLGDQVHRLAGPFGIAVGVVALAVAVAAVIFVRRHEARLIAEAKEAMRKEEKGGKRKRPGGAKPAQTGF